MGETTTRAAPLPKEWPAVVKTGLLEVVALARLAVLDVVAGFADGPLDARQKARIAVLERERQLLLEELRIKDARMARLEPRRRPHFDGEERLAILALKAARGWTAAEAARRFLLTAQTLATWFVRREESGDGALVRTREPVNRYPDFVAEAVRRLRASCPALGTKRIADMLARAGLHLAEATVRRLLERKPGPKPCDGAGGDGATAGASDTAPGGLEVEAAAPTEPPRRPVAKRPHDVWHVDLTFVPTWTGLFVPWLPFSLPQCWPFGWWVGAALDQKSRVVVRVRVWRRPPTARSFVALLKDAVRRVGVKPKAIISDQGVQFREVYRAWCEEQDIATRFGAVHRHGSIAILERFWRSMKDECFRQFPVPLSLPAMRRELAAYLDWYHRHRPHQALGGATPAEVIAAEVPARDKRRLEPRPKMPLQRDGPPGARRVRKRVAHLALVVDEEVGAAKLPVVSLRRAA